MPLVAVVLLTPPAPPVPDEFVELEDEVAAATGGTAPLAHPMRNTVNPTTFGQKTAELHFISSLFNRGTLAGTLNHFCSSTPR